jgi:RNA polymerase sigma-70 factor (ECF subfamily)
MGAFDEVLAAAREGEGWALSQLYRATYPRFVRYASAVAPDDAHDVAADAWLDIARSLHRFKGDEHAFRAWAFTIARRRLLDLQRSRARRRTDPVDPEDLVGAASRGDVEEEALASLGTDRAIWLITSSLSRDQAEVVLLRVIGDLGVDEVASIMGKRPGTIRVLQHRAIRQLAQVLRREGVTR